MFNSVFDSQHAFEKTVTFEIGNENDELKLLLILFLSHLAD